MTRCKLRRYWCAARDLNPHPIKEWFLRPSCLPFHQQRIKIYADIFERLGFTTPTFPLARTQGISTVLGFLRLARELWVTVNQDSRLRSALLPQIKLNNVRAALPLDGREDSNGCLPLVRSLARKMVPGAGIEPALLG